MSDFQALSFLGVSDSEGHYQVLAPDADQYGLNIERGILTKEAQLIGSEPAIVIKDAGDAQITGPPLSILRGERTVFCRVVDHVGRDVSYAKVTLLPEPGKSYWARS